jgi:hypothetical protein
MYFSRFPKIIYAFLFKDPTMVDDGIRLRAVTDITLNVRPIKDILENIVYYEDYDIQDGDTPEIIAERIYGEPTYHWIIMLVNEKYHYLDDFPVPDNKFEEYVTRKYDPISINAIHDLYGRLHYIDSEGSIVDSDFPGASPVTNLEFERELNEAKRRIRIVNPKLIGIFVKDLEEAFAA